MYNWLGTGIVSYAELWEAHGTMSGSPWIIPTGPGIEIVGLVNFIQAAGFENIEEEASAFQGLFDMYNGQKSDRDLLHTLMLDHHEKEKVK